MLLGRMLELSRYGLINCFTLRRLNPPTKWFSFFILTSLCCCSLVFFLLETTNISSPCLLILLLRLYLPLWYLCHFFNLLCSYSYMKIHKTILKICTMTATKIIVNNDVIFCVPDDVQSLLCPKQLFCSPISMTNGFSLWKSRNQKRHFPDPQLLVHHEKFSCYCCLLLPLRA